MSIAPRDREALDLALKRSFADAYVASLDLEMQTRRLTLGIYGRSAAVRRRCSAR